MFCIRYVPFVLATLLIAASAAGNDGQQEINITCAYSTGCFPGDTPGLPVTITAGGSYRLTSNIDFFGEETTAIMIRANDVTIDMAGFRIRCQRQILVIGGGPSPLCGTTNGNGSGIRADNIDFRTGSEVKNGSVIGMAGIGVRLGWHSVIRNMRISDGGGMGIQMYFGGLVEGSILFGNETGMDLHWTSGYRGNVLRQNTLADVTGGVNLGGNMCSTSLCP